MGVGYYYTIITYIKFIFKLINLNSLTYIAYKSERNTEDVEEVCLIYRYSIFNTIFVCRLFILLDIHFRKRGSLVLQRKCNVLKLTLQK